jgi:hypothetical protein
MSTPAALTPPPRSIGQLAWEIRNAWLAASAAIPLPDGVEGARFLTEDVASDPRVTSALDARHDAFGWALGELIDGGYHAPGWQLSALRSGHLPDMTRPGLEDEPPGVQDVVRGRDGDDGHRSR